jgi:GT2 family glycosyltransferase
MSTKISVIVPTYWTSINSAIQQQVPDAIYDHPTPLEKQSTLPRLLDSLKSVDTPKGNIVMTVIVAVTHKVLEEKAEEKTREIINDYKNTFDITQFSASTLRKINSINRNLATLFDLYGYSNIRNIGLAIAQILKSDIIVFLDDDVIVDDENYFHKAQEFVGKKVDDKLLGGIAGYYVNKGGKYYLDIDPKAWWKVGWPKEEKMNEAFKVIKSRQRLTETTFAFGGNMILHWKMFEKVPFDPYIARGEDMDLLANAKMFGFKFMLDTKLQVLHLPGEKKRLWSEMRQDLYRFFYMRQKLLSNRSIKDIKSVSINSLEPYPGYFLRSGTCLKFAMSNCLNIFHSISEGDFESSKEYLRNVSRIPSALQFAKKYGLEYFRFQKAWSSYIPKIRNDRVLKNILESSA